MASKVEPVPMTVEVAVVAEALVRKERLVGQTLGAMVATLCCMEHLLVIL